MTSSMSWHATEMKRFIFTPETYLCQDNKPEASGARERLEKQTGTAFA
jgi:hypothetical protein